MIGKNVVRSVIQSLNSTKEHKEAHMNFSDTIAQSHRILAVMEIKELIKPCLKGQT